MWKPSPAWSIADEGADAVRVTRDRAAEELRRSWIMPSWLIPDGFLPDDGAAMPQESHEALCVLNPTDDDATVEVSIYFADREPLTGLRLCVPARRSIHARLDQLRAPSGDTIPHDVPYALRVRCPVAIGVQHSRMDTRQANLALFTTVGQRYDSD